MFAGLIAWLRARRGRTFAPATIPAWILAVVAVASAGWVIFAFFADRSAKRMETVQELHSEYGKQWADVALVDSDKLQKIALSERCEVIRERVKGFDDLGCDGLTEQEREAVAKVVLKSAARRELRERIEKNRDKVPVNGEAAENLFRFFDGVRVCVDERNCDEEAAVELLGKEMTTYLNAVCVYANPGRELATLRNETIALAQFLLDNGAEEQMSWSEDEGRESLFFCSYLRGLRARRGFLSWLGL